MKQTLRITALVLLLGSACAREQSPRPDFQGMWSDPPSTAVDAFCFVGCTDSGIANLNALLDDAANDNRPYDALVTQALHFQLEQYVRPRLTTAALETFPLDPADDPGFLTCEPWGFARQIFAPHQMDIRQFDDRIDIRYGEWDAQRTVYMDDRSRPGNQPASPMGYSVGHYEGNTLVVETSGVSRNITFWFAHSDQLRAVERYTRSTDGKRLEVVVTIEDPWSLRQPVQVKKAWGWAPTEQIFPYVNCEKPSEFRKGTSRP
jgi:hypothetical protein